MTPKPWIDLEIFLATLQIGKAIRDHQLVGSTYTLGHGRDIDFAVLIAETDLNVRPVWLGVEWQREGSDAYEGNIFASYRNGNFNLIVMNDAEVYRKYLTAMEVCKALKLQTRRERVIVCRIVRDGMTAEQAESISIPGELT
jgi:hypothetical protein